MARNKNSTALFDVIHAAKKPPKSSPSASIPAPRWWGKDKKITKPAPADSTETVGRQQSWLSAAKRNGGVVPPAAPVVTEDESAVELPAEQQYAESDPAISVESTSDAPKVRFVDRFKTRTPITEPIVEATAAPQQSTETEASDESAGLPMPTFYSESDAPQVKPEKKRSERGRDSRDGMVGIDRATGDVRFHLSMGGMIAIGFIMLIVLAIAFIAGTHSSAMTAETDSSAGGKSTTTNSPSSSGMMAAVSSARPASPTDANRDLSPDVLQVSPKNSKPAIENNASPKNPTVPLPIKATRDIGMIYVVIQSYPDQEIAQKACDFMNHAGVPCTVVQGLSAFALRDWFSVVGLQPFKKHDPGLDEYERSVAAMGVKFSNKIYNQFQPQGYTWRTDSEQEMQQP